MRKHARREKALEAVRRHLRRLEIETHRVKAELARLEADYEDDVADDLARMLPARRSSKTIKHYDSQRDATTGFETRADEAPAASVASAAIAQQELRPASGNFRATSHTPPAVEDAAAPRKLPIISVSASAPVRNHRPLVRTATGESAGPSRPAVAHASTQPPANPIQPITQQNDGKNPSRAALRRTAPPLLVSFGIHAVAIVLFATLTFATLVQQNIPLFGSPALADEMPEPIGEIEITAHKFDDSELQNVVASDSPFNVTDNLARQFDAPHIGAGTAELGDMGQLDSLPSDLGSLLAGAGDPGSGKAGGPLGDAVFFGAQSKGNRFVYVVDNSSSMKGGRLDTAVAELVKSIDALTPRQSFYVIFVSDQTYPMFYPVAERALLPATAANKQRLAQWLPKAILASGKNRELIKAMDLAAALQPHAVFLLWDGDMKYSDKVRMDVMTHLTQPNQWKFAIHTLGMGVTSLDAEYNLTAIAQAHGGTFRRVDVPTPPKR